MIVPMHSAPATTAIAIPGLLPAQLAIAAFVLLAAVFAPPRVGEMAVMPIVPLSFGQTIDWVTTHHGRTVGRLKRVPLLMVFGHRSDLLGPAIAHGALLVRLPSALCGRSSPSTPTHAGEIR